MICTISKHRAERRGYADALMLDWQGRVAECTDLLYTAEVAADDTPEALTDVLQLDTMDLNWVR